MQALRTDPKARARCLVVLRRVLECGGRVAGALEALAALVSRGVGVELAACLAAAAEAERGGAARAAAVAGSVRRDVAAYLRLLHALATTAPRAIDITHFKAVIELVPKLLVRERRKCWDILSAFVQQNVSGGTSCGAGSGSASEAIADMYELLEPSLSDDPACLQLCARGLRLMRAPVRDRVVSRAAAGGGAALCVVLEEIARRVRIALS
ncbi:unnamed protein product [Leptidea sinapis]|uniref:Uncharacterized protein n=1 Tax=Leptidea sinapis TaxID=189913 RepID=A0A5E4QS04_9NEOP|nr:unnamed protein product [Leptidea sinapis]